MLLSGIFFATDIALAYVAFEMTSVANVNILCTLTPLTIVPVTAFLFKEKIPKFYLAGALVAIAGVIAMEPEVLVLDEPAAGLDPMGRDGIFEGIVRYGRETGATVIIVSHSMEDMARFCDELIVMAHARIAMKGNCAEVFSRAEDLEAIGLTVPQITRLMVMLKKRGVDVSESLYTVEDAAKALATIMKK